MIEFMGATCIDQQSDRQDNLVAAVLLERKEKGFMGRIDRHGKLSPRVTKSKRDPSTKAEQFPVVSIDEEFDFASIKLAPGIEARSYLKDGVLFSEDAEGRVIELQIINVKKAAKSAVKKPRKAG